MDRALKKKPIEKFHCFMIFVIEKDTTLMYVYLQNLNTEHFNLSFKVFQNLSAKNIKM